MLNVKPSVYTNKKKLTQNLNYWFMRFNNFSNNYFEWIVKLNTESWCLELYLRALYTPACKAVQHLLLYCNAVPFQVHKV
jgi:hypothetical protein